MLLFVRFLTDGRSESANFSEEHLMRHEILWVAAAVALAAALLPNGHEARAQAGGIVFRGDAETEQAAQIG